MKKAKKTLRNNFLLDIIETFEDFLDEKGIRIPNEERDAEDPDNQANLYGNDFDNLMDSIREICEENGITVLDEWED